MFRKLKFLWRSFKSRYCDHKIEIEMLLESIKPGDIAIDVGANKGSFAHSLAMAVGKKGRLLAFEPQMALAKYLRQVFSELSLSQCEVYEVGISDRKGSSNLHIPMRGTNPSASIIDGAHIPNNWTSQKIQITSLDLFLTDEIRKVACIKIDVEGNELNVIKGALGIINKYHPVIVLECEQRHLIDNTVEEIIDFIIALDYEGFFIQNKKLISIENFVASEHQATDLGAYWDSKNYCNNFIFKPRLEE